MSKLTPLLSNVARQVDLARHMFLHPCGTPSSVGGGWQRWIPMISWMTFHKWRSIIREKAEAANLEGGIDSYTVGECLTILGQVYTGTFVAGDGETPIVQSTAKSRRFDKNSAGKYRIVQLQSGVAGVAANQAMAAAPEPLAIPRRLIKRKQCQKNLENFKLLKVTVQHQVTHGGTVQTCPVEVSPLLIITGRLILDEQNAIRQDGSANLTVVANGISRNAFLMSLLSMQISQSHTLQDLFPETRIETLPPGNHHNPFEVFKEYLKTAVKQLGWGKRTLLNGETWVDATCPEALRTEMCLAYQLETDTNGAGIDLTQLAPLEAALDSGDFSAIMSAGSRCCNDRFIRYLQAYRDKYQEMREQAELPAANQATNATILAVMHAPGFRVRGWDRVDI